MGLNVEGISVILRAVHAELDKHERTSNYYKSLAQGQTPAEPRT